MWLLSNGGSAHLFSDADICSSISVAPFVEFFPQDLFLFALLLDFFGLLGIFVEFDDTDDSEQLDDTNSTRGCSWGFGLGS